MGCGLEQARGDSSRCGGLRALAGPGEHAQRTRKTQADRGEIRGLKLGLDAQPMRLAGFGELACGSNGGAPRQPLDGWSDIPQMPARGQRPHEVYARFDDEDEYIGRAIDDPVCARQGRDTARRPSGDPVGAVRPRRRACAALRLVTDPRAASHERRMAHLLRLCGVQPLRPRWMDLHGRPPAEGETAVGGVFVKQRCEKLIPERHLFLRGALPAQARPEPMSTRGPANTGPASSRAGRGSRSSSRDIRVTRGAHSE